MAAHPISNGYRRSPVETAHCPTPANINPVRHNGRHRGHCAIYIDSWNASFGALLSSADRTVTAELSERWRRNLALPVPHRWWVAERLGKVIGFAGIRPSRDPVDPQIGELDTIAVDQPHRRSGIGRALISLALDDMKADGYRESILWTVNGYERGIAFYEAMGWRRDGGTRDAGRQIRFRHDLADIGTRF